MYFDVLCGRVATSGGKFLPGVTAVGGIHALFDRAVEAGVLSPVVELVQLWVGAPATEEIVNALGVLLAEQVRRSLAALEVEVELVVVFCHGHSCFAHSNHLPDFVFCFLTYTDYIRDPLRRIN